MPYLLNPISRRKFIASAMLTTAGCFMGFKLNLFADSDINPDYFILLADTHINQNPDHIEDEYFVYPTNMSENLSIVVKRIVNSDSKKPAAIIINGDVAHRRGFREDYLTFKDIISPLSDLGIPILITMGNHDDRGPFYQAMPEMKQDEPLLRTRHVNIIETPNVYLFLLDTLYLVNQPTGKLGELQLSWLNIALKQHSDKPVILFGHHNLNKNEGKGLLDTDEFYNIILPLKHVKAYFYGHTHAWQIFNIEKFYLVNQPTTAGVFQYSQPSGFVHAEFKSDHVHLRLDCLDTEHPRHGQEYQLIFRDDLVQDLESDEGEVIKDFRLYQNYPNPFNASTTISYELSKDSNIRLEVFEPNGRRISLLQNDQLNAGHHEVIFNAEQYSSGVYIYKLSAGKFEKTKKMVLLK